MNVPLGLGILGVATVSAAMLGLWLGKYDRPVLLTLKPIAVPARKAQPVRHTPQIIQKGEDATSLAQSWPEDGQRLAAFESECLRIAETDPSRAISLAQASRLPAADLIAQLAERWSQTDLSAALAWVRNLPDPTQRTALLNRIALITAESDPASAAALVTSEIQAGHDCHQALTSIVGTWARSDPRSVAQWVKRFPAGSLLDVSVENLIDAWSQSDPAAARAWLATLPAGTAHDQGQAAFANAAAIAQGVAEPHFNPFGTANAFP